MRIALITSVYGEYDPVRPVRPSEWGFDDAVIVTDDQTGGPVGWRLHWQPTDDPPRLAAKRAKMLPWLYTDCDAAVWIDASIEITDGPGLRKAAETALKDRDLIVWQHPEGRTDIRQEGPVCWDWPKYAAYPIRDQVQHYSNAGMPENWGLFACGVMGWRFTDEAKRFGNLWLDEQYRWSIQDQISLPFLLWREGFRFGTFPAHQYKNPWFRIRWDERPAGQGPAALS